MTPREAGHVVTVWPDRPDFVTLQEARNWLGLYGDSSLDDQVRECLNAAIGKVSNFVGFAFQSGSVTEHFPPGCRNQRIRLGARQSFVKAGSVAVAVFDSRNQRQAAGADEWTLDPTTEHAELILSLRSTTLSTDFALPVLVTYALEARDAGPDTAALKSAVQLVAQRLWSLRGQTAEPGVSDRALSSLLQSVKLDPAVA